jgi:hypothetical protein
MEGAKMNQPKYKFGQKVTYYFTAMSPTHVEHKIQCSGKVVGIKLDPNGTYSQPVYIYELEAPDKWHDRTWMKEDSLEDGMKFDAAKAVGK